MTGQISSRGWVRVKSTGRPSPLDQEEKGHTHTHTHTEREKERDHRMEGYRFGIICTI